MAGFSRASISDMMVKEKEAFPSTWLIRAMGSSRGANDKRALGKCQVIEMSQFVFTDSAEKEASQEMDGPTSRRNTVAGDDVMIPTGGV